VSDERALALELDRALAGEPAGDEASRLAAVLVAVAEPARFEVADDEVERGWHAARPPRRRSRRAFIPALGLAAAALAVAALVWQVRTPGVDVQAHAARALDATFFVVEEVRPARPGAFEPTTVSGYVDGRTGRVHARISGRAGLSAETVVNPDGTVARWVAASNTITLAPSCRELAQACADLLDPLALYVRALDDARVTSQKDGSTYRLSLVRGRLEEVVVVEASTYLPARIEWRQDGRPFSSTRLLELERETQPVSPDTWELSPHPGARVRQVTAAGDPVRVLGSRPGRLTRGQLWLGATYEGHRARVTEVELSGGRATRIAYGPLTVWNYADVVPPAVLQNRAFPAKVFTISGGAVVHAYFGESATVVAEASFGDRNAAVVSARGDKEDAVRAVEKLRRL